MSFAKGAFRVDLTFCLLLVAGLDVVGDSVLSEQIDGMFGRPELVSLGFDGMLLVDHEAMILKILARRGCSRDNKGESHVAVHRRAEYIASWVWNSGSDLSAPKVLPQAEKLVVMKNAERR